MNRNLKRYVENKFLESIKIYEHKVSFDGSLNCEKCNRKIDGDKEIVFEYSVWLNWLHDNSLVEYTLCVECKKEMENGV